MRNTIRTQRNEKRLGKSVWALVIAVCFLLAFSLIGLMGRLAISHTYAAEADGEELTETVDGEVTDASDETDPEIGDNEGEVTLPEDNTGDEEGEVTPPSDNTGDDEGEVTPPADNTGDDEGEVTPPSDNTGDDEGEVTPPADNTGDNEGQTTPPVSGSENSNGNTNGSQDSAAGTTGSANGFMGFLQNYWWVLAIAGVVLLVVIFSIVGAKRSKKHKRLVEDKRLQALDEERERQERLEAERKEERRMEQEARMEAMRQQQMMQQQMMPMMPQMMMPQMPMQQQPVQQVQQIPAPQQPNYGGNTPSFELMRMAEEKARAEERARLAEERIMHYMQDQRLRSATNAALPSVQYQQQQPAHDPAEERLRIAEERARKAEQRLLLLEEERLKQQAIQQAPAAQAPQEKPKEVTIKLTDNAVTMLSGALAGLVGAQQVPVQPAQPAPMQGSPVTVQFVQPAAPNVQYVPVQPVQPARPAQTVQPSIAPAAQENGQSEESAPVRRRLRL